MTLPLAVAGLEIALQDLGPDPTSVFPEEWFLLFDVMQPLELKVPEKSLLMSCYAEPRLCGAPL
jgi:hypothetical protein